MLSKLFILILIIISVSHAHRSTKRISQVVRYADMSDNDQLESWYAYKSVYGKDYVNDEEETLRFGIFRTNLLMIDKHNDEENANVDNRAVHGITKFADLSSEEFQSMYLTATTDHSNGKEQSTKRHSHKKTITASGIVDWTGVYTGAVEEQKDCGCCWAFSTAEQIHSDAVRAGLLTIHQPLSVEQLVECDTTDKGCTGGNPSTAFAYVIKAGGIALESKYPYTSSTGRVNQCGVKDMDYVVRVESYALISNESDMIDYVSSTGPLSVCVDARTWKTYTGGVITTCGTEVDHCVQIVGIDNINGSWKVRNSWGTDWGEKGYINVQAGKDMCGITRRVIYSTVSKVGK